MLKIQFNLLSIFLVIPILILVCIQTIPPSYATQDQFGITEIVPTVPSGWEWFSNWNNRSATTLTSGTFDPLDPYFKATGNGAFTINGNGTAFENGTGPRFYVFDKPNSFSKLWNNTEQTIYYRLTSKYAGSIANTADGVKMGSKAGSHSTGSGYTNECIDVGLQSATPHATAPYNNTDSSYNALSLFDGRGTFEKEVIYNFGDAFENDGSGYSPTINPAFGNFILPVYTAMNDSANLNTIPVYNASGSILVEAVSATSSMVNHNIDKIELQLKRSGSPVGLAQVGVFGGGTSTEIRQLTNVPATTTSDAVYNGHSTIAEHVNASSAVNSKSFNTVKINIEKLGSPTGTMTIGVFDKTPPILTYMSDINNNQGLSMFGTTTRHIETEYAVNSSSVLVSKTIDHMELNLYKSGSPTGNYTVGVFNSSGILTHFFANGSATALTTTQTVYTFNFGNYTIQIGDRIGIMYTGGSSGNSVNGETDTTAPFDTSHSVYSYFDTTWHNDLAGHDMYMVLQYRPPAQANPTILKTIATVDVSTLPQSYTNETYQSATLWTVSANQYIGVQFTGGNATSYVGIKADPNALYDGTNSVYSVYDTQWNDNTGRDMWMILSNSTTSVGAITLVKDFGTINVGTLSTSYDDFQFTIPTNYTIQNGDKIGIQFTSGDASNYLGVKTDNLGGFDGTNSFLDSFTYLTGWSPSTGQDMYMILTSGGTLTPTSPSTLLHEMPKHKWIGMKLITKTNSDKSVTLTTYRDDTDGLNGGTWVVVNNYTDVGGWKATSFRTPPINATNWIPLNSTCHRIGTNTAQIPLDMVLNRNMPFVYFRTDHIYQLDYKKASVREILTTAPTPTIPTPIGKDPFAVNEIYPTIPNGMTWFSNWNNGIDRTFGFAVDPQDPWFDAQHGTATYHVDGTGQLIISGSIPRMYVHDPTLTRSWRDVEGTLYAKRVNDSNIDYGGIEMVLRSNHGTTGDELLNLCDTRGLAGKIQYFGDVQFEKETSHPNSVFVNDKTIFGGGLPYNVWIGYKFIVYDLPNGNVKEESYMDLTNGAEGGTWVLINSFIDNGTNFGTLASGGIPCKAGVNPALKLLQGNNRNGSESGKPNITVYFRSDGIGANGLVYKYASFREINASGVSTTPVSVGGGGGGAGGSGGGVPNSQDLTNVSVTPLILGISQKQYQLSIGSTLPDNLKITWNLPDNLIINSISYNSSRIPILFPFTPFVLQGSNNLVSSGEIPFTLKVPYAFCDYKKGLTAYCVDPVIYRIPVKITASTPNGQSVVQNTEIDVNMEPNVQSPLGMIVIVAGLVGVVALGVFYASKPQKPKYKSYSKKGNISKTMRDS